MYRRTARSPRWHLVVGVALAAAAALITRGYAARAARATVGGPSVAVVVAAGPIERGAVLTASLLRVDRIPASYAPPGSIDQISKAAGRVVLADLAPHEAVTETRLARVRAGPVASLTPRGLRAFAVPVTLPAGAVIPGDHVDVLATYASDQPHTEVVVEGVEILYVLDTTGGPHPASGAEPEPGRVQGLSASTLILLVSPYQEQRLAYARAFADLEVSIVPSG